MVDMVSEQRGEPAVATRYPGLPALQRLVLFCIAGYILVHVSSGATSFYDAAGRVFTYIADDSMITCRVASNFAHGKGLYFNSGEHVAANTSLFWPIILAPIFKLFDAQRAILIVSQVSIVLSLLILLVVSLASETVLSVSIALVLLVFTQELPSYAGTGWEHVPQCLLVTLAFCAITGRLKSDGNWSKWFYESSFVLLSCAFLIRPDTAPLLVIPGAVLLLRLVKGPSRIPPLVALAWGAVSVIGYYVLHYSLYHSFFPNTFYLKVSFGPAAVMGGVKYCIQNFLDAGVPCFLVPVLVLRMMARKGWTREEDVVLAGILLQTIYIVIVGGDVFEHGRFFLVIMPSVAMLVADKLTYLAGISERWAIWATWGTACFLMLAVMMGQIRTQGRLPPSGVVAAGGVEASPQDGQVAQIALTACIREHIRPSDGEVGLFWLGALGYYLPDYRIADFLGKADSVIAHEPVKWGPPGHSKWDIDYTVSERNVSVIPLLPESDDEARKVIRERKDFGFWASIVLSDYVRSHYTYLSPERLGCDSSWGLLVRNDLVSRFH